MLENKYLFNLLMLTDFTRRHCFLDELRGYCPCRNATDCISCCGEKHDIQAKEMIA